MSPLKNSSHLLVVDDDAKIRELLQKYLIENGYFVSTAKDPAQAVEILEEIKCNLIILDLMMPGENGIEFTKKLRSHDYNKKIPIIMLTAMGEMENKIEGLEVGADDYVVKPFEAKELLLRINNILKRNKEEEEIFYFGDFIYSIKNKSLQHRGSMIFLTQSEHSLINLLLKSSNVIVSRQLLAEKLHINERSVDVQIIRLRNKIESNPSRPQFLQTIRNQGYIFRI